MRYDARASATQGTSLGCARAAVHDHIGVGARSGIVRAGHSESAGRSRGYTGGADRELVPALRRSHERKPGSVRAIPKRRFQSRFDGEYCECKRCIRIGYDEDSWHPVTTQFWRTAYGRIDLSMCKACIGELVLIRQGVTVAIFNAKEGIRA